ncbi:hypothetical protein MU852_10650 [Brevundimonas albigilva]|uniref:hypothetical protein n=1 Tax=Brevundimonas albigilva TaxID=1312364 RepID=UPI00201B97A1|nr:hypothetical protein [Brevundimonas albigilva]UQV17374.1 hypothetical protein MU852_10650 [Brevundimonas albigilva]
MNRTVLLMLLAAGAGLSACATADDAAAPPPLNALSRYVLQVEPGVDRIALAVHERGCRATSTRRWGPWSAASRAKAPR